MSSLQILPRILLPSMFLRARPLARSLPSRRWPASRRWIQYTAYNAHPETPTRLTNILADDTPLPVQVSRVDENGILLEDGLRIKGSCIFYEGKVFLWDVGGEDGPTGSRPVVTKEALGFFDVVIPRPEILILGTGRTVVMPSPSVKQHITDLGIQLSLMDTRNACSTYNLLAEEGRRVAAALLPLIPRVWARASALPTESSPSNSSQP